MDKIFVIADIHSGPDKKSTIHPGYFRQKSDLAKEELKNITKYLPQKINLYLQIGDLVRYTFGQKKDSDTNNFVKINQILSEIFPKIINITGNHDTEIQENHTSNIEKVELDNGTIIIIDPNDPWKLDISEIDKLKKLLNTTSKPILMFTHIPMFPIDANDNFYFYQREHNQYFQNYQEIYNLLKAKSKVFIISGHYHWLSSTEIDRNIKQITLPAFSENIITSPKSKIHPCVYNLIEINKGKLIIKSYSRQFCFSSLEFSIPH